jgi:hypothetical protein
MRTLITLLLLCQTLYCFCQTTHSVTVLVNQPPACAVVALEKNLGEEITVFPNPAKDLIFIKNIQNEGNFELHDALGRIVFEQSLQSAESTPIDVHFFQRGIYYLRIRTGQKTFQSRIVLE